MRNLFALVTCREAIDSFGADHAGELDAAQRWRLTLHLLWCRSCRTLREHYARTIALCALPRAGPRSTVPEDLVQRILRARRAP